MAAQPATNTAGFQVGTPPAVITSETRKYDNVETGDLALMIETLQSAKTIGRSKTGATADAYKALAMRLESAETGKSEPRASLPSCFQKPWSEG